MDSIKHNRSRNSIICTKEKPKKGKIGTSEIRDGARGFGETFRGFGDGVSGIRDGAKIPA